MFRYRIMCFLFLIVMVTLTACRSHDRFIENTVWRDRMVYDSVFTKDSVFVNQYVRGDTVFNTKDRWRTYYKEKIVKDTAFVVKEKYIRYTVKQHLSWWQNVILHYSLLVIIMLALLILLLLYYIRKLRQQVLGSDAIRPLA